jgi:RimJ/RimL family protein N-acetyltransferase
MTSKQELVDTAMALDDAPQLASSGIVLSDGVVEMRSWQRDDVAALSAALQDPETSRWTTIPWPYTEDDALAFLDSPSSNLGFAVLDRETRALIGGAGVVALDSPNRSAEIGYWIAEEARRRGHASRAVRLLTQWALEYLHVVRVEALVYPANVPSQRVLERVGYRREALLRAHREVKGSMRDMLVYSRRTESESVHPDADD